MENQIVFIKADNDVVINEKCIKWVKKIEECLSVCTKSNGCTTNEYRDTHKICKLTNPNSYNKLNNLFN
jgi:hypothetical protein